MNGGEPQKGFSYGLWYTSENSFSHESHILIGETNFNNLITQLHSLLYEYNCQDYYKENFQSIKRAHQRGYLI